jgi:hypothetical protein
MSKDSPGPIDVLGGVLNTTVDRYNIETLQVALTELNTLADNIGTVRCMSYPDECAASAQGQRPEVFFSRVSLADDPDKKRREKLQQLDTSLGLLEGNVQATINAGFDAARCLPRTGRDARRNVGAYPGLTDLFAVISRKPPVSCAREK